MAETSGARAEPPGLAAAFIDAVLDTHVPDGVFPMVPQVRDVLAVAQWLAPVHAALCAAPAPPDDGLRAAVEAALRKRLADWRRSASEVYAGGDEAAWQNGLIGYLMRGPGSVTDALAAHPAPTPVAGEGDGLAWEAGVRQAIEWLRADYEYGTGPDWREHGAGWIAERLTEHRREATP